MKKRWPEQILRPRFADKVERTGGCWFWHGAKFQRAGRVVYGCFYDGHRNCLAHRVSFELAFGPIPRGMIVRHRCNVSLCVRPDHLELGTHEDNIADQRARHKQKAPLPAKPQSRQYKLCFEGPR